MIDTKALEDARQLHQIHVDGKRVACPCGTNIFTKKADGEYFCTSCKARMLIHCETHDAEIARLKSTVKAAERAGYSQGDACCPWCGCNFERIDAKHEDDCSAFLPNGMVR